MKPNRNHKGNRANGCRSGKVRYHDHRQAARALRLIRRGDPTARLRAYECDWCDGWHLTSKGDW